MNPNTLKKKKNKQRETFHIQNRGLLLSVTHRTVFSNDKKIVQRAFFLWSVVLLYVCFDFDFCISENQTSTFYLSLKVTLIKMFVRNRQLFNFYPRTLIPAKEII